MLSILLSIDEFVMIYHYDSLTFLTHFGPAKKKPAWDSCRLSIQNEFRWDQLLCYWITISTRLFNERASSLVLGTRGMVSPLP